ncbi:hypothetical protein [Bacteriophage sp.]|nr:hypothetical protein [Bacteriophage sp.]UOF80130.1 hypothetical protein [Bacteriophage sp.]
MARWTISILAAVLAMGAMLWPSMADPNRRHPPTRAYIEVSATADAGFQGTETLGRPWTYAAMGNECTSPFSSWPIRGATVDAGLPQFGDGGTTCNQTTTGLAIAGLGETLVSEGVLVGTDTGWQATVAAAPGIPADQPWLSRVIFSPSAGQNASARGPLEELSSGTSIVRTSGSASGTGYMGFFRHCGGSTYSRTVNTNANTVGAWYLADIWFDDSASVNPTGNIYVNGTSYPGAAHSDNCAAIDTNNTVSLMTNSTRSVWWHSRVVVWLSVASGTADSGWFTGETTHDTGCTTLGICP